jgi:DNA polymerase-3 subunit epsilon
MKLSDYIARFFKKQDIKHVFVHQVSLPYLKDFMKGCDFAGFNSNKFDFPLLVEEFLRAGVDFDVENRIQFSVYLCGNVTEDFLATLSNTKTLQNFIESTYAANKQAVVFKQDLQEYDPLTNKVKVDKKGREKKLESSNLHPLVLKYLKTAQGSEDAYNMDSVIQTHSILIDNISHRVYCRCSES